MDSPETDFEYWHRRAEEEVELARRGRVPAAVAAHYRLSELYLSQVTRQVDDEGQPPVAGQRSALIRQLSNAAAVFQRAKRRIRR